MERNPAELSGIEEERRRIRLTVGSLAAAVLIGVVARSALAPIAPMSFVLAACCIVAFLLALLLTRWDDRLSLSSSVAITALVLLLFFSAALRQGISAPVLVFLPLVPLLAGLLCTRVKGAIATWTVLVVALLQLFLIPTVAVWLSFVPARESELGVTRIFMLALATGLTGLFAWWQQQRWQHVDGVRSLRQHLYNELFSRSRDIVAITDLDGRVLEMNETGRSLFDHSIADGMISRLYSDPRRRSTLLRQLTENGSVEGFESSFHLDGEHKVLAGSSVLFDDQAVRGGPLILSILRDVTERQERAQTLERLAFTDSLTGLANRSSMDKQLDLELDRARRHGRTVGVLIIDVDQFKRVNDADGHAAGDQLLCQVAGRFANTVRKHDLLARYGGDEFVVLLCEARDETEVRAAATKLSNQLREPIQVEGKDLAVKVSIGGSLSGSEDSSASLLARADEALYKAKEMGRNRIEIA